jgi:hypothetical protein
VPGQFGTFPEEHSQSGIRPYMGSSLPDVESYNDLFLVPHPKPSVGARYPPSGRPERPDIRFQNGIPALAHETIMGQPDDARKQQQTTRWYVTAYLHADDRTLYPSARSCLTASSSEYPKANSVDTCPGGGA